MEDQLVAFGFAVSSPVRVALLRAVGEDGLTLTEAAEAVGVSAATAFYHFAILVDAGLVRKKGRRRGSRYLWPDSRWQIVCRPAPSKGQPEKTEPD